MNKFLQQPSVASLDEGDEKMHGTLRNTTNICKLQHKPVPVGVEESPPSMHFIVAVFAFIPAPSPRYEATEYMDDYDLTSMGDRGSTHAKTHSAKHLHPAAGDVKMP